MYMWDCIMILLYYTCYEYFIMICDTIGYCLYWDVGAGETVGQFQELHTGLHPELQQTLPSASRAHCPADVPAGPPRHAMLVDASSASISQHAPPEAAGYRMCNNRIV